MYFWDYTRTLRIKSAAAATIVAILVPGVQVANAQVLRAHRRCAERDNLR